MDRHAHGLGRVLTQFAEPLGGDEILHRVADHYPELLFSGLIKLAKVTRIEVGWPGDFANLGKQKILENLQAARRQRYRL